MIPLLEIPDILLLSILLKLNALPFTRVFSANKSMKAAIEYHKKTLTKRRRLINRWLSFWNWPATPNPLVCYSGPVCGQRHLFGRHTSDWDWLWHRSNLYETLCYFKFLGIAEDLSFRDVNIPVDPLEVDAVRIHWDTNKRDYIKECKPKTLVLKVNHQQNDSSFAPLNLDHLKELQLDRISFQSRTSHLEERNDYLLTVASPFVPYMDFDIHKGYDDEDDMSESIGKLVKIIVSGKHGRFKHLVVVTDRSFHKNLGDYMPENAIARRIKSRRSNFDDYRPSDADNKIPRRIKRKRKPQAWIRTWTIPLKEGGFILVSRQWTEIRETYIHVLIVTEKQTLSEWNSTYYFGELNVFRIWREFTAAMET